MEKETRHSILKVIAKSGENVASRIAEQHNVSRQTSSSWLSKLKKEGAIILSGVGRSVRYELARKKEFTKDYQRDGLQEDILYSEDIEPHIYDLPKNVKKIWHYAITEIVNNAVDHSGSDKVIVHFYMNEIDTSIYIIDNGEGIFLKIQKALKLYDPRQAIIELAKGKLTTDPTNHSGEGIFFTSKMMEKFDIVSGGLHYTHGSTTEDYFLDFPSNVNGTMVFLNLSNDSNITTNDVFDKFSGGDDYTFSKTIVPIKLAQYEGNNLVSRSQAKRLTQRFDKFEDVMLDFEGVEDIGQAFADELFRVFANANKSIKLTPIHQSDAVRKMIARALSVPNS